MFNKLDPPLLDYKKMDKELVSRFLWHNVCRYKGIKDFLYEQASLCKYTSEVFVYMMITSKEYLGLDI